ncbi:MAG: hypothetical protein ACK4G3_00895, partial [bacterium]
MREVKEMRTLATKKELPVLQPPERHNFGRSRYFVEVPNLLDHQRESYNWFKNEGLKRLFAQIFPIHDEKKQYVLDFYGVRLGKNRYDWQKCKERGLTYQI